jgi:hypothetical protein
MFRSISGIGKLNFRCAPTISRTISSTPDTFDLRALAARLPPGFRQRDIVYAIEELSQVGLPHYKVGDPIPRANAEVILEIGLQFDSDTSQGILQRKKRKHNRWQ